MTFSIELRPYELDIIQTALIGLGGKYSEMAKAASGSKAKLYAAKSDDVFKMFCSLPSVSSPECCEDIASHCVEVSKAAWGNWF